MSSTSKGASSIMRPHPQANISPSTNVHATLPPLRKRKYDDKSLEDTQMRMANFLKNVEATHPELFVRPETIADYREPFVKEEEEPEEKIVPARMILAPRQSRRDPYANAAVLPEPNISSSPSTSYSSSSEAETLTSPEPYQAYILPSSLSPEHSPEHSDYGSVKKSRKPAGRPRKATDISEPREKPKQTRRPNHEIPRNFFCRYPDCDKSYEFLNHLNTHIEKQNHGRRLTKYEYKEWEEAIKAATSNPIRLQNRASMGDDEDDEDDEGDEDDEDDEDVDVDEDEDDAVDGSEAETVRGSSAGRKVQKKDGGAKAASISSGLSGGGGDVDDSEAETIRGSPAGRMMRKKDAGVKKASAFGGLSGGGAESHEHRGGVGDEDVVGEEEDDEENLDYFSDDEDGAEDEEDEFPVPASDDFEEDWDSE